MPTAAGTLRRILPVPSQADMSFSKRGFSVADSAVARRLETVPRLVMFGFEQGADARDNEDIVRRLATVDADFRGLAYEGAVVALIIRDMISPRRSRRALDFVRGPAAPHIFMAYIGYGFLMSHLPRRMWQKRLPDFGGPPALPGLTWLAVDGYGFDRAYLDTRRFVDQRYVPRPFPWEGSPRYFPRALDQGIGRSLWFVHGGDAQAAAATINRFPPERRADLWSGLGSAVTFVGGAEPEQVRKLLADAGEHRADLAQGAVFSAKARHFSGLVPEYTAVTTQVITGLPVESAVRLVDDTGRETRSHQPTGPDSMPGYEHWRARVRQCLDESRVTGSR